VVEFAPFLNRIEKRMVGLNKLLSYQGRVILVNSILSALPTFYMCAFKMLISILEQVDKYRKHCLWNHDDVTKTSLVILAHLSILVW
jgi:hypothetical protein